jgi:hypothetical protein
LRDNEGVNAHTGGLPFASFFRFLTDLILVLSKKNKRTRKKGFRVSYFTLPFLLIDAPRDLRKETNMEDHNIKRRTFLYGMAAAGTLGVLTLTGCAPKAEGPKTTGSSTTPDNSTGSDKPSTTPQAPTTWVDAVASASVATNAYTNLDKEQLIAVANALTAECTVATTNEDGTPNIAVFGGGSIMKGEYIVFNWTDNQSKANLMERKLGMVAFDVVNLSAETKQERHKGAKVRIEYVDDKTIREELKAESERVIDATLIVRIVEILPIG